MRAALQGQDRVRSSLGYEYYDAYLRRLAPSLDVELAWTGGQAETASGSRCLRLPLPGAPRAAARHASRSTCPGSGPVRPSAAVAYRPTLRQAHPVETLPAQDVHRRVS